MKKLLNVLSLTACLALGAPVAFGEEPPATGGMSVPLAPDAPASYQVQRGDTLWAIARRFLRDPWSWPEIWYVNPEIANPHRIYPGDTLRLVRIPGASGVPGGADETVQVRVERGNTVHLSPQMRGQPLDQAIPTIPYEIVAAFISKPSVVSKEDLARMPYVLALRGDRKIAGLGDVVYARGLSGAQPSDRFGVVELGAPIKDPDDGKVLGYMGIYAGSVRVDGVGTIDRKPTNVTRLTVVQSAREIIESDRLVSDRLEVPLDFVPHAPRGQVDGRIMSVVDGVTTIGQYHVVTINRGRRHGLEPGHMLSTWQHGEKVHDSAGRPAAQDSEFGSLLPKTVRLPDERSGTLMVFRCYDRMSYALMLFAEGPVRVGDAVRNP